MAGISSTAAGHFENIKRFNDGSELESKEFSNDFGLDLYSTEFRNYDHQIGRFIQTDPLVEANEGQSPYVFANNNPILLNDPFGLTSDTAKVPKVITLDPVVVIGKLPPKENSASLAPTTPLPINPLRRIPPPGKVVPMNPPPGIDVTPNPLPFVGVATGLTAAFVLLPLSTGPEGSPMQLTLPYPFNANKKDNWDEHIVYQFTFVPTDGKTPFLKYGISDFVRYGISRPELQEPFLKIIFGPTVKMKILTHTTNREEALLYERQLVTDHVKQWGRMPRYQFRPLPFNF